MKREEIIAYIDSLPQNLFKEYGFKKTDDISGEKCEIVNGYKYYPDLHAVLIGSRYVVWETGNDDICTVDPYNSVHFEELKKRGMLLQDDNTIGVITFTTDGRLMCFLDNKVGWPSGRFKQSSEFISFTFDGTEIYYHPENKEDMKNPEIRLLAECLFLGRRYCNEYIVPYKNMSVEEWG